MEKLPPYVRSQLKKIENSLTKAAKFDERICSFFSESTLDPKILFAAATHLVSAVILSSNKFDKFKILSDLLHQMNKTEILLDAFLNAFYETSTKTDDPVVISNVNEKFIKENWSILKKTSLLSKPIPQKGCFDRFIINVVLRCSQIADIANSRYLELSDPDIIKRLTNDACSHFVDARIYDCFHKLLPLPHLIFTQEKLISSLCTKRRNYDALDKCLQITFEKDPEIIHILKQSWNLLVKEDHKMIFLSHVLVPFADVIPNDTADFIINSNTKLYKQGFDYNAFMASRKCMMLAQPKILIALANPN